MHIMLHSLHFAGDLHSKIVGRLHDFMKRFRLSHKVSADKYYGTKYVYGAKGSCFKSDGRYRPKCRVEIARTKLLTEVDARVCNAKSCTARIIQMSRLKCRVCTKNRPYSWKFERSKQIPWNVWRIYVMRLVG